MEPNESDKKLSFRLFIAHLPVGTCQNEACSIKICDKHLIPPAFLDECFQSQVDNTISDSVRADFAKWQKHDDKLYPFCHATDDFCQVCDYVDLTINPETFTGYSGPSAQKVWKAIYDENCFFSSNSLIDVNYESFIEELCMEKRVFFRALSGLHSSISIHLSAQYPILSKFTMRTYGPNKNEFDRRFAHENGQHWLKNLYFLFLLELQALNSVSEYLKSHHYYTADKNEDKLTKDMIKDILEITSDFENPLFRNGKDSNPLPFDEFQLHLGNINQIMNCVGCDKCKLWGKLQITGLTTAFKILFGKPSKLKRKEIVALLNSFGRLSASIYQLSIFREM